MWTCPECKIKNSNLADFCCVCGTSPDGTKKAVRTQYPEAAGVTRRFSVGTFMIMTTLFGVLFAIMKILNLNAVIFADVAVFFAGIGVAQMILFQNQDPRKASWIAGLTLGPAIGIGTILISIFFAQSRAVELIPFGVTFIILGGPFGYMAGCLIAGIFLVREREKDEDGKDLDMQNTINENRREDIS